MSDIFIIAKSDNKVFKGDKLRIDLSETFLEPGDTFLSVSHEISFDGGTTYVNVSMKKGIDWIFSTSGAKVLKLRVSSTIAGSVSKDYPITVLDQATQGLFSNDSDLYVYETDVDQYLPKRWSSWNLVHLKAQEWIIDWLDEKGIFKADGSKYAAADLLDVQQVKQLACYKTLQFIYESNSNVVGDLFSVKAAKYLELSNEKASRSQLKLDYDGDGLSSPTEKTNLHSVGIVRS